MTRVRPETPGDHDAIRDINRLAFGGADEAHLVDRLRADGDVIVSLVAERVGRVAGHILFSTLKIDTDGHPVRAAALAPMAVRPEQQRRGIGSALVREGLEACRRDGVDVVVVLGYPDYYPRFGFSADRARRLRAPFGGDAFMALELTPGALDGVDGAVCYPPAFGLDGR